MPIHLLPTADLAPRALLPGDPGRALTLAQLLLDSPRMFNHARGLWGYTGTAADGAPLTIQATGIGGSSTAAVLEDLAGLGLEVALRVGTCRADGSATALGTILTVGLALAKDGVSRAANVGEVRPDPEFAGDGLVVTRDRLHPGRPWRRRSPTARPHRFSSSPASSDCAAARCWPSRATRSATAWTRGRSWSPSTHSA